MLCFRQPYIARLCIGLQSFNAYWKLAGRESAQVSYARDIFKAAIDLTMLDKLHVQH